MSSFCESLFAPCTAARSSKDTVDADDGVAVDEDGSESILVKRGLDGTADDGIAELAVPEDATKETAPDADKDAVDAQKCSKEAPKFMPAAAPEVKHSKVCKYGSKCHRKNPEHTSAEAHPADADYLACCRKLSFQPEFVTVRKLFDWCDSKGIGKAMRDDLVKVWGQIQGMGKGIGALDDALWQTMDDDGNGYVNFAEFAEFTTAHEVNIPLGLDSLLGSSSEATLCCGVHDCNCKSFTIRRRKCKYGAKCYQTTDEHLVQFCHPKDGDEWKKASAQGDALMCKCGHKQGLHAASFVAAGAVPYPAYWTTEASGDAEFNELVRVTEIEKFQELLNATYSDVTTRDRQRHCGTWSVPRDFKLFSVQRNENSKLWRKYIIRKKQLERDKAAPSDLEEYQLYDDVKTTQVFDGSTENLELCKDINEWYLFHGTSSSAARNICMYDFKMRLAGSATGTLYGRGSYMAESITKADEYSKEEGDFFTVLLCRVLGGRVKYCDDKSPDPDELTKACIEGPCDCILGDRKKISGTYREFIIFDSELVYPEFVLQYKRGEFFKSPSHPEKLKEAKESPTPAAKSAAPAMEKSGSF